MKVVVGGPSHSGKSTFAAGLVDCIRERKRRGDADVSFRWETLDVTDNSLAHLINDREKPAVHNEGVEWNEQTARTKRATFAGGDERLVVADTPGRLTPELDIVLEPADAMILLVSDEKVDLTEEWLDRAEALDVEVGWVLTTVLDGGDVGWYSEGDVRRGILRIATREEFDADGLDAFDSESARMIRQVAEDLVERATRVEA